ncbi:MAG: cytochrome d ubiquinol oxidase subunit II [Candidatus Promineifilaceae bacterium]|nr:cytochrome d ubiquinol oxidase subunit II [Candidatus Promineifilaceae bacterium]
MTLNVIWYILFVIIIAGYLIMDGFDIGVGILHLFVAKDDTERRILLNSIGPVWDGNEVWLVLGGGALFAAFPLVYASLFSGFYIAMLLVLVVLILRTVAIEFRSKEESPRWRSIWDFVFFAASLGIAILLGVAFGNIIRGVPINENQDITVTLIDLLSPFTLLVGLTTVFMLASHGGLYLIMKTEGELQLRVRRWIPRLMILFFVLNTLVVAATLLLQQDITNRYLEEIWPVIFPVLALAALLVSAYMLRQKRDFIAFLASGAMIALLLLSAAAGLYPNLLISTIDPAYSLTIFNAASEQNTLSIMLVIALIGIPFVLLYTAGVYYFFRGKVKLTPQSY